MSCNEQRQCAGVGIRATIVDLDVTRSTLYQQHWLEPWMPADCFLYRELFNSCVSEYTPSTRSGAGARDGRESDPAYGGGYSCPLERAIDFRG